MVWNVFVHDGSVVRRQTLLSDLWRHLLNSLFSFINKKFKFMSQISRKMSLVFARRPQAFKLVFILNSNEHAYIGIC